MKKSSHHFLPPVLSVLWVLLAAMPIYRIQAQTNSNANTNDAFIKTVSANFLRWDKDHNQTLSVEELDAAIENPANRGQAAAALAALKRAARSTNYTLPPLTLANISQLASNAPATNRPNLRLLYRQGLQRITNVTSRELFASGLPQLNTIRQGRMGDCFCLAPLGAMIHRDPHEVAALFSVQADGQVRVEFGGGPVAVAPPTDAELAMTAGNSHDGVWVNLYEKAIGEARNDQRAPEKRSDLAIDAIATGGSEGKILSYLTGHKVTSFGFKFAKDPATSATTRSTKLDELRRKISAAVSQNLLMVCGTTTPTTPGLTPKHAYALLNYASQSDTVDLWNPHGNDFTPKGPAGLSNGYPTKSGFFTVPLAEFVQQFRGMAFETRFRDVSLESAEPAAAPSLLKVGDPAPKWKAGKWIQGDPIKKFSPGKAYLVEFWATWSEPCRVAVPYLNEIQNRYQDKGLIVVGQDCWEHDQGQVAPFIKTMGDKMSYRVVREDKPFLGQGKSAQNWLSAAGRESLPTAFLVDTQGRIAWIGHPFALKDSMLEEVLAGTFNPQQAVEQSARERETKDLFKQASALAQDGKLAEAESHLNRLLAETNDDADQTAQFLVLRANVLARSAHWQQAADDLAQVKQIDPSGYFGWGMLTPLLIQSGKVADYQAHCKAMLDRFGNTTMPRVAEQTAKTCLLLPGGVSPDDLTLAGHVAENAVALSEKGDRMHWRLMTKGLAEYRLGHFTNAIEQMELSQKAMTHERDAAGSMCKADACFVMAMSRQQLKQPDQARADLASGLEIMQTKLPKLDGGDLGQTWYDVLPAYILMREAKAMIDGAAIKDENSLSAEKL